MKNKIQVILSNVATGFMIIFILWFFVLLAWAITWRQFPKERQKEIQKYSIEKIIKKIKS